MKGEWLWIYRRKNLFTFQLFHL